eukprot:Colp12_sorted_trinity150504_noHs@26998
MERPLATMNTGVGPFRHLLQSQPDSKQFLASSHFAIGMQKDARTQNTSTMKDAYKTKAIPTRGTLDPFRATHSNIIQGDPTKILELVTTTQEATAPPNAKLARPTGPCNSLRVTNFKMDSDHRLASFKTTAHESYRPYDNPSRANPVPRMTQSHVPEGDTEKVVERSTTHSEAFKAHPEARPATYTRQVTRPLYMGDTNSSPLKEKYTTVSSSAYQPHETHSLYKHGPRLKDVSIPQGDREKVSHFTTTTQDAFVEPGVGGKRYNRREAVALLRRTNFNQGTVPKSAHGTTAADSYVPWQAERVRAVGDDRVTHIPCGDEGKIRDVVTSHSIDFKAPPHGSARARPAALQHLATHFRVGDDYNSSHVQSTMHDSYNPHLCAKPERAGPNYGTAIVYGDAEKTRGYSTSHGMDFQPNHGFRPERVQRAQINHLRGTHFKLGGDEGTNNPGYTTTMKASYFPKQANVTRPTFGHSQMQESHVAQGDPEKISEFVTSSSLVSAPATVKC